MVEDYLDDEWEASEEEDYSSDKSYASFWLDRFGGLNWAQDSVRKFEDALRTVFRTVNIISNANASTGEEEREISVRWSDGQQKNTSSDNIVYLSPNLVDHRRRKQGWGDAQVVDVLIGTALTESAFKATASQKAEIDIADWEGPLPEILEWMAKVVGPSFSIAATRKQIASFAPQLWYLSEQLTAQNLVLKDFPGFRSYFQAIHRYYTSATAKREIQRAVNSTSHYPTIPNAVAAMLWNLLHPRNPIALPKKYQRIKKWIQEMRECCDPKTPSEVRASKTVEILIRLAKIYTLDPIGEADEAEGGSPESEEDPSSDSSSSDADDDAADDEAATESDSSSSDADELESSNDEGTEGETEESPQCVNVDLQDIGAHSNLGQVVPNETGIAKVLSTQKAEGPSAEENQLLKERKIFPPDASSFSHRLREKKQPASSNYPALRRKLLPLIAALKNKLKLRNEEVSFSEKGTRRGDLDEGSLYKLGFIAHGLDDPRVFEQKTVLGKPDVAFLILVDESGSMAGSVNRGYQYSFYAEEDDSKWNLARKSAIIVAEALKSIEGVKLAVVGHTVGNSWSKVGHGPTLELFHYLTPDNPAGIASLGSIFAHGDNADGYALERAFLYMLRWFPNAAKKVVIHISDGLPSAEDYGGSRAHKHVKKVCQTAAKQGIHLMALGIDSEAMKPEAMTAMYGKNWAILKDAATLPIVLSNLMAKVVKEANPKL